MREEDTIGNNIKRGFGSAVQSIVDYFEQYEDLNNTKVITFLAGNPNYGLGVVEENKQNIKNISPINTFFKDQSIRALYSRVRVTLILLFFFFKFF